MFTSIYIIGAIGGISILLSYFMPLAGVIVPIGYLFLLSMMINMAGMDVFVNPLGKHEIINLFITKTRKIIPEVVKEDEGYAKRKKWGLFHIAEDTAHKMGGKPTIITAEGIPYSLKIEEAFIARIMNKLGINTKEELAKFLDVPLLMVGGEETVTKPKTEVEDNDGQRKEDPIRRPKPARKDNPLADLEQMGTL